MSEKQKALDHISTVMRGFLFRPASEHNKNLLQEYLEEFEHQNIDFEIRDLDVGYVTSHGGVELIVSGRLVNVTDDEDYGYIGLAMTDVNSGTVDNERGF